MNSRNAIQQELDDLGSSLPFNNYEQPVFTVPDGFFENFAVSVWAKIKSQHSMNATEELNTLSPLLAAIPKLTPFSVPENYFSNLATGLPALVNEEAALPGLLQSHTKQMPYIVPDGYFDGLAAQVAAKVAKPKAKVVSLSARVMRYAVAAALIGVMAVGGIFYLNGSRNSLDPDTQSEAWIAQKLKNVTNSDLEAFLRTADTGFNSKGLAQKGNKAEVRQMLRDVSTTELDAFLKELPADNEFSQIN